MACLYAPIDLKFQGLYDLPAFLKGGGAVGMQAASVEIILFFILLLFHDINWTCLPLIWSGHMCFIY